MYAHHLAKQFHFRTSQAPSPSTHPRITVRLDRLLSALTADTTTDDQHHLPRTEGETSRGAQKLDSYKLQSIKLIFKSTNILDYLQLNVTIASSSFSSSCTGGCITSSPGTAAAAGTNCTWPQEPWRWHVLLCIRLVLPLTTDPRRRGRSSCFYFSWTDEPWQSIRRQAADRQSDGEPIKPIRKHLFASLSFSSSECEEEEEQKRST